MDRYQEYADRQFEEQYRQFYCGAPQVPDDILQRVLRKMGPKFRNFRTFKPITVAPYMEEVNLLTYEELVAARNRMFGPKEQLDAITSGLYTKGNEGKTLVKFYHCMIDSSRECPSHAEIAREIKLHAIVACGLQQPILADEEITGVGSSQTLNDMVGKLRGKQANEDFARNFVKNLGLSEEDIPQGKLTDVAVICIQWLLKKPSACTPLKLIEALLHTKCMGRIASGLCYPTNPPEVVSFFVTLNEEWLNIAYYLGYREEEIAVLNSGNGAYLESQVRRFLNIWEMPDCGTSTVPLLHKLAQLAGVSSSRIRGHSGPCVIGKMQQPLMGKTLEAFDGILSVAKEEHIGKEETCWVMQVMFRECAYAVQQSHTKLSYGDSESPKPSRPTTMLLDSKPETGKAEIGLDDVKKAHTPLNAASPMNDPKLTRSEEFTKFVNKPTHEAEVGRSATYQFSRDDNDILIQSCKDPSGLDMVKTLLESGKDLSVQQSLDGAHPLHLAVKCGSLEMATCLLHYGSNIDALMDDHRTPLMVACQESKSALVTILIQNKADINAKDCNGYSCLHYRETLQSPEIVAFLLKEGKAEVDIPTDGDCLTPLTRACLLGDSAYKAAQVLIDSGAEINGLESSQIRPLTAAAGGGHERLIDLLIERGAVVDGRDKDGSTAVLRACQRRHTNIVNKLIDKAANLNIPDKEGTTPVMAAVENNSVELLQLLLAYNADLNQPKTLQHAMHQTHGAANVYDITPLSLAAARGRHDIVEMLLEKKANLNYTSQRTLPTIAFAILTGQTHIVEYLLKLNELRKGLHYMRVPFITAVQVGNHSIAYLLLHHMGGQEKVLIEATEAGYDDLANHICHLEEMTKEGDPGANIQEAQVSCEEMETEVITILEDFTQLAIQSVVTDETGQAYLIEEAGRTGSYDALLFFQQYFIDSRSVENLFGSFINGDPSPAKFLFGTSRFSATAFAELLQNVGQLNLMEKVEIALLQFPAAETLMSTGADLMRNVFGERFYIDITAAGLSTASNPKPHCNMQALQPSTNGMGVTKSASWPSPRQQLQQQQHHQKSDDEDHEVQSCCDTDPSSQLVASNQDANSQSSPKQNVQKPTTADFSHSNSESIPCQNQSGSQLVSQRFVHAVEPSEPKGTALSEDSRMLTSDENPYDSISLTSTQSTPLRASNIETPRLVPAAASVSTQSTPALPTNIEIPRSHECTFPRQAAILEDLTVSPSILQSQYVYSVHTKNPQSDLRPLTPCIRNLSIMSHPISQANMDASPTSLVSSTDNTIHSLHPVLESMPTATPLAASVRHPHAAGFAADCKGKEDSGFVSLDHDEDPAGLRTESLPHEQISEQFSVKLPTDLNIMKLSCDDAYKQGFVKAELQVRLAKGPEIYEFDLPSEFKMIHRALRQAHTNGQHTAVIKLTLR